MIVHRKMKKIHPIFDFFDKKIFGTKFGSFCTIPKRFEQNWIKNSIAVRVYFWTFFENLDFPKSLLAPLCSGGELTSLLAETSHKPYHFVIKPARLIYFQIDPPQ